MSKPCKEWTGGVTASGYGTVTIKDPSAKNGWRTVRVHRHEWAKANGPVPPGMFVCHHCDNRLCYELEHLFLGTHADNMRDMWDKGRAVIIAGERHGCRKLSASDVRTIRSDHASGVKTKALAERYGIHRTSVQRVVNGKKWGTV